MARYLEQVNECTDPDDTDWFWTVDTSAGATDKDRKVSGARLARRLQGIKTAVPHNVATNLCRLDVGGSSTLAAAYLIALNLSSADTASSVIYLLSQGFSVATIAQHVAALFGHTSVTVTATADTANRRVTLAITQVNGSSQAADVRVGVIPLGVWNAAAVTLTML